MTDVTELGRIPVRDASSALDARSKMRDLARALAFDEVTVTRLATAISRAARDMACKWAGPSYSSKDPTVPGR